MDESQIQIRRRRSRKKPCFFCTEKITVIDYKNPMGYKRFVLDRGKIVPKRNSGVCAKHQRKLAMAIKRARYMGLIPYCVD